MPPPREVCRSQTKIYSLGSALRRLLCVVLVPQQKQSILGALIKPHIDFSQHEVNTLPRFSSEWPLFRD